MKKINTLGKTRRLKNEKARENIKTIKAKFNEINSSLKNLDDEQFKELIATGIFTNFLTSILNPKISSKYENLQEFFFKNKNKLSFMAGLRYVITENYSFKGNVNNSPVFVSPFHSQWIEGGVIFLQGENKFTGLIGLYDSNKDLYFARSKKDFSSGESIDLRKDLFFDFIYQKINKDKELDDEQKKQVIDKLEDIKNEKDPKKRKSKFEGIKDIIGKAWYLSNKAFWDSVWENLNNLFK